MRRMIEGLFGHERAVANARAACTELSRRRVEREEVEQYLERRLMRLRRSA
ncbi:MAG: hypothetical protein HOQ45_13495 [Nocardioidaceae bacterium]|nr:hypothetical protein [Nocardioidaceae bacterium]